MSPVRVLVVDDSAFARKVMREVLGGDAGIEVVGIARDGLEALEKIAALSPDVVTLDLVMPHLDGLGVLAALNSPGAPRVIVVSSSDAESDLGVEALALGAVDLVHKPTSLATDRLYELAAELRRKVLVAAQARPRERPAPPITRVAIPRVPVAVDLVVVGTSTGGPHALSRLLGALPGDFPVPMAAVVHIPEGYTESLARRLDDGSLVTVVEASEGLHLSPGTVVLARGGLHLRVKKQRDRGSVVLSSTPDSLHRPSVNVLFESAAEAYGGRVLGVVMTGMGDDGVIGARAIRDAGGRVLCEAESTCVVHGMPRAVREAGLCDGEFPLDELAAAVVARLSGG